MIDQSVCKEIKQNNIAHDSEKVKERIRELWKKNMHKREEILELAGIKKITVERSYKKGTISAKLAISMSQILNINPYYLTGEIDNPGESSYELILTFLRDNKYGDLVERMPKPKRKYNSRKAKENLAKTEVEVTEPKASKNEAIGNENVDYEDSDIENDDIENDDIENDDIENDDIENDDIENDDIENDDIEEDGNGDIDDSDTSCASVVNGNLDAADNSDVTESDGTEVLETGETENDLPAPIIEIIKDKLDTPSENERKYLDSLTEEDINLLLKGLILRARYYEDAKIILDLVKTLLIG